MANNWHAGRALHVLTCHKRQKQIDLEEGSSKDEITSVSFAIESNISEFNKLYKYVMGIKKYF